METTFQAAVRVTLVEAAGLRRQGRGGRVEAAGLLEAEPLHQTETVAYETPRAFRTNRRRMECCKRGGVAVLSIPLLRGVRTLHQLAGEWQQWLGEGIAPCSPLPRPMQPCLTT